MTLTTGLTLTALIFGVLALAFFTLVCIVRGTVCSNMGDSAGSNVYLGAGVLCLLGMCFLSFSLGTML